MSDTLLHQLLPTKVAATLRSGEKVAAKDYPSTTVLFSVRRRRRRPFPCVRCCSLSARVRRCHLH